ncbi:MAG: serine/threonine-protein kinase [Planctomycetaceae bacterium]
MMLQSGDMLAEGYEVIRRLGAGGMATVYHVRHRDGQADAALKIPHPALVESSAQQAAVYDELQAWMSLPQHPHLLECYFVRELEGRPVVFSEYLAGGDLATWAQRGRIHGVRHVLDLCIQLSEAMAVVQNHGMVHRDLKPANCFLNQQGHLKLGDFGLAAARDRTAWPTFGDTADADGLTASEKHHDTPLFAGTQEYASPEQFDGRPVTSQSDIWSLGVTMLELLSGTRPRLGAAARWAAEDFQQTAAARDVPDDVFEVLMQLLEPDPVKRLSTFRDVSQQLQRAYARMFASKYPRVFPNPQTTHKPHAGNSALERSTAQAILNMALRAAGQDVDVPDEIQRPAAGKGFNQSAGLMHDLKLLKQAATIYETLFEKHGSFRTELASVHARLASTWRQAGSLPEAIASYTDSISILRKQFDSDPQAVALTLIQAIHDRAVCRRQTGQATQAIDDYAEGIELFRAHNPQHFGATFQNLLANLHSNRAMALLVSVRLNEALGDAETAIAMRERLHHEHSNRYAVDLAGTCLNRAVILRNLGRVHEAIEACGRSLELSEPENAAGQLMQRDDIRGTAYLNRCAAFLSLNQLRQAAPDADMAIQLFESAPQSHDVRWHLSMAYNNRASIRHLSRDISGAIDDIDHVIELREHLVQRRGQWQRLDSLAKAYSNRALFLFENGQHHESAVAYDRAIQFLSSLNQQQPQPQIVLMLSKIHLTRAATLEQLKRDGMPDAVRCAELAESQMETAFAEAARQLLESIRYQLHAAGDRSANRELQYADDTPIRVTAALQLVEAVANAQAKPFPWSRGDIESLVRLAQRLPSDRSDARQILEKTVSELQRRIAERPVHEVTVCQGLVGITRNSSD